jgi:hypothetical protein
VILFSIKFNTESWVTDFESDRIIDPLFGNKGTPLLIRVLMGTGDLEIKVED